MPFCPYGEPSYVHLGPTHHFGGHDDYDAVNAYGLGVRGNVAAQEFWGECGHNWVVAYGEHKGGVFVKVVRKPDTGDSPPDAENEKASESSDD